MQVTDEMVRVALGAVWQAEDSASMEDIMRSALTAALAAMWQPIETAPKDGTLVLVHRPTSDGRYIPQVGIDWWGRYVGKMCWAQSNEVTQPTHWMPLPPAPFQLSKRDDAEDHSTHEA